MSEEVPMRTVADDGTVEWRLPDGRLHRDDGPACIDPDGAEHWFRNGKKHRDDGPALVRPDGTQEWWRGDERHRLDGPAVILPGGIASWWVKGKPIAEPSTLDLLALALAEDGETR